MGGFHTTRFSCHVLYEHVMQKKKTKKQLDLHIAPVYETVLIKTSCVPDFWIYNLTSVLSVVHW